MSAQLDMFASQEPNTSGVLKRAGSLPHDFVLVPNFVSGVEEAFLLDAIDREAWSNDLRRRVQHYGFRYDYKTRNLAAKDRIGPLPAWAQRLAETLVDYEYFSSVPDQMIVNEYLPGQGINAHIDRETCFGPVVASLSLGSDIVMDFADGAGAVGSVLLPRRSLLVLSGDARTQWRHSIAQRRRDVIESLAYTRQRRVSLTFRTVLLNV